MARLKITLSELLGRFERLRETEGASAYIGMRDPEAGVVARVLEFGSVAGQKPWPRPAARTVTAVNPDTGATVVVSAQAPQGYIRVRAPQMAALLREHLPAPLDWLDAAAVEEQIRSAVRLTALAALEELRGAVPADSGDLRDSLTMATD
jgi:hypothetical protein